MQDAFPNDAEPAGAAAGFFESGFTESATCLPEDLLLLCARLRDGRIMQPAYLSHALAGAALAEFLLAGTLRIDGKHLHPTGAAVTYRHPALADAFAALPQSVAEGRSASISTCLYRVRRRASARPYRDSLTASGLLRRDETRLLGLIPRATYTLADPSARASRVARIDATVASPHSAAPRDLALATLAIAADLAGRLHPTRPDRATRTALKALATADPIASAVATSIRRASQAAASS